MEQLTKNQAVATSQEAVQNQNEPQLRDENAHNDKSVHGVLNPTYQAGLRRDAVDRKSGSAGMPRPISYAVFCLKKKKTVRKMAGLVKIYHTLLGCLNPARNPLWGRFIVNNVFSPAC